LVIVMELSGKQKRFLRGAGHSLRPLLTVGKHGLTEDLIREVDQCLLAHELIKVKVLESSPLGRSEVGPRLGEATGCAVAQTLGRTVLLYRPHPEEPRIELPE
jgi:RNA-binding protein